MDGLPKVTVITVLYNSKDALQRTINSVRELKYPNIEYIIVDGYSTDGTREVIESNYLDITRWISEKDSGIYDAMNKGIDLATGEYIWFVNAGDIIYDPYILDTILKGSEQYYDIYYGDTLIASETGEILGLRAKRPPRRLTWKSFKRGMTVCHQSLIVRRAIVPKYNLSYRFSSDVDWVINILKTDVDCCNTKAIISVFEEGGATKQNKCKSLGERWSVMRKHYGFLPTLVSHITFTLNIFKPKYRKFKTDRYV